MNKIRLGVDIDGTVTCPSALIPFINDAFRTSLTLEDIKEYDLTKNFDVDPVHFAQWYDQNEETIYEQSPPRDDVLTILPRWQRFATLHYITARGEHSKQVTTNWLQRHTLPIDSVHFVGSHDKVETARSLQIDAFLEDKYDNAITIAETLNIPILLFDTPWNQLETPRSIIRVSNWKEAERALHELFPTIPIL